MKLCKDLWIVVAGSVIGWLILIGSLLLIARFMR
jgi:hypothetical protein